MTMIEIKTPEQRAAEKEIRKKMFNRIFKIEKYNYANKEFTNSEMVLKIQKIIEEELK